VGVKQVIKFLLPELQIFSTMRQHGFIAKKNRKNNSLYEGNELTSADDYHNESVINDSNKHDRQ